VNLDYRSLFLHFECNAVFYEADIVEDLKKDYLATQNESREITENDIQNGLLYRFGNNVLRLIAPLL
jgi:cardiolipin synthase